MTTTKTSGIYKIVNRINHRYYVGSSSNIDGSRGRWKEHAYRLRKGNHQSPQLQNAWNKYGSNSFDWIIIEKTPKEFLLITEQKYLDVAKTEKEKCYNTSFIAGRVEMTPEVRQKISAAGKGRKHSEEWKEMISKKMRGRVIRPAGWHHTTEAKRKISEHSNIWNKGKKLSPDHIRKLVISHLGIPQSQETRDKRAKKLIGQKRTPEQKERMKQAALNRNSPRGK